MEILTATELRRCLTESRLKNIHLQAKIKRMGDVLNKVRSDAFAADREHRAIKAKLVEMRIERDILRDEIRTKIGIEYAPDDVRLTGAKLEALENIQTGFDVRSKSVAGWLNNRGFAHRDRFGEYHITPKGHAALEASGSVCADV